MRARAGIVVLIVLVTGALAALVWSAAHADGAGGPRDFRPSPAPEPRADDGGRAAAASAGQAGGGPARREAGRDAAGAPETAAAASVRVQVVAPDGGPAPGAVVHLADPRALAMPFAALPPAEQRALRHATESRLTRLGTRVVADDAGIARWPSTPPPHQWWHVVARAGDAFGETWIGADAPADRVHTLQLQRDVTAHARVLDERHTPVVGIGVVATFAPASDPSHRGWQPLGDSDERGEVVLHHVQAWASRIAPNGASRPAQLAVDLPGVAVAVPVDAAAMPAEPVLLFVPPTGAIDVLALDVYGAPRADLAVVLRPDGVEDGPDTRAVTDAAGAATFARVGLGHAFRVGAAHVDPRQHRRVEGPRAPEERVAVRLQPAAAPLLTGRLLRDGVPVANERVTLAIDGQPAGVDTPHTAADGAFRVAVTAAWLDRRVQQLSLSIARDDPALPGASGAWRGELHLTAGEHALGDVVLLPVPPEPVLVEGTLATADGSPAPDAARLGIQVRDAAHGAEWRWAPNFVRRTGGAFRATGAAPVGQLRVVVYGGGFAPVAPVPFAAGARDVRIVLSRGGSVRATVLPGSPVAAHCLEPLLVPRDAATPTTVLQRHTPHLDSRAPRRRPVADDPLEEAWEWPAVAPGRYRLDVHARGAAGPLWSVDDVVVTDGERNEDPRLQRLRVPGLFAVELTITLPPELRDPPREPPGFVFVLDGDRAVDRCVRLDTLLAHVAAVKPIDVLVRFPGCRDRSVRAIAGDTAITLEPGILVVLRAPPPAAGDRLTWSLEPLDDPVGATGASIYSPAAGGMLAQPNYRPLAVGAAFDGVETKLRLGWPGRYRVRATVRTAGGAEREAACEPAEVRVGGDGGAFDVSLR